MTIPPYSTAWFLEESADAKMYKAICNYMSLGQFELARPLLRMHHEAETTLSESKQPVSSVINLMLGIIEAGTPDGWICSIKAFRSTSHLHSMCIELIQELVGHDGLIPELLRMRCDFELRLTLALLESETLHNLDVANELRQRFVLFLSDKFKVSSIFLPRLLIACDSGQLLVIESTTNPSEELSSTPLNLDCTEWVFDLCRNAPSCGPAFLEILHTISPLVSVQLTHIQAALVCDSFLSKTSRRSKRWKKLCRQIRFLNELNNVITDLNSVNDPLLVDLVSLLVAVCNCENGFEIFSSEFASSIDKLINDCLSPNFGAFPFIMSKKRRSLFNLGTIGSDERFIYSPNDHMRQLIYESLATVESISATKSLLQFFGELEDSLLKIFSSKVLIPPCFTSPSSVPFWDLYYDFIRVSGNHCLEYPATTAMNLIKAGEMNSVKILLSPFNQMKPLIILLCWQIFDELPLRSALIEDLARSYSLEKDRTKFTLMEQSVTDLSFYFESAKLASSKFLSSNCLEILDKLRSNVSFFKVIRTALPKISRSEEFFEFLSKIPPPSVRLSREFFHDLDFARTYFALREAMGLVVRKSGKKLVDLSQLSSLCHAISDLEIREKLLNSILGLLFSKMDSLKHEKSPSQYIVEMNVFISLLCLVCKQADRGRILLLKFLLALKQSTIFQGVDGTKKLVSDWVQCVSGSDAAMASLCDSLDIPKVVFEGGKIAHVTPPATNMRIDNAAEFIPRLVEMDLVQTALELNDYNLADELVEFLKIKNHDFVDDAKKFAKFRSLLRERDLFDNSKILQELKGTSSSALLATMLIDLGISSNSSSEISLSLLHCAQRILLCEENISPNLTSWSNKLLVLLEAKTEFNSTKGPPDSHSIESRIRLPELILGIETLPNEPELLKDHLSRMHSQRSAIMSLVDRVDKFRRNTEETPTDKSPENTGNHLDFLAEAIRTLEGGFEDVVGQSNSQKSSFLIKFLEYLNKVCFLIQEAATVTSVSFFSVLSERPVDLVAKLVFVHKGIPQAIALCETMGLDIVDVIAEHSVGLFDVEKFEGKFFISQDILELLSFGDKIEKSKIVGIALERRSERWPSSEILDFASQTQWVEGRKNAWEKFVRSFKVLTGQDVARGFTIEEEKNLDFESRLALGAIHSGSTESMDALCRISARALMVQKKYISALEELDTNLVVSDSVLINEALMGCLNHSADSLSPQQIYELLWRITDGEILIKFVKIFYRKWNAKLAMKALELCLERIENNNAESESWVLFEIQIIRVMDKVSAAVPDHGSWQELQELKQSENCVAVIRELLQVHQHNVADEFLSLKSKILAIQVDALADEIELSRLGSMWKNHEKLLERLQTFHHPLKASRLAIQLLASINVIGNRIFLSDLFLSHKIACEEDEGAVETELASLALFSLTGSPVLRDEWFPLLGRPDLVFESLLMNGVTDGIGEFLERFKSWRNDALLLRLARRAVLLEPTERLQKELQKDIGLGGSWSLSGEEMKDKKIRENHRFSAEKPNMNLAIKFLNLCNGDSKTNANAIFDLAEDLSLFFPDFISPGDCQISSGLGSPKPTVPCPFSRPSFVRQAILCFIDLLMIKFSKVFKAQVAEFAKSNLDLLVEIWTRCGVRIGLKGLSNPVVQLQLRDFLIQADALDLAEKVCYALGQDRPGSREAADVVNMERVKLLIRVSELKKAREIACNFNAKKLSIQQLEEIAEALQQSQKYIPIEDFENGAKIYTIAELEKMFGGKNSRIIPRNFSQNSRELISGEFCSPKIVERFCVLSQITTGEDGEENVLIQTPITVRDLYTEMSVENSSNIPELLFYCSEHGEEGSSVYFLIKAGMVNEAIKLAISNSLSPKIFVPMVSRAITPDSSVWSLILSHLIELNSKTYLSAIETFLRSVCAYAQLYPYEVAMGREAHAAVLCVHLYLRAVSWEEKLGHLESSRSHLEICWSRRKFSKRVRGGSSRRRRDLSVSTSEIDDGSDDSENNFFHQISPPNVAKISLPFSLPMSELDDDSAITDAVIQSLQTLVELQLEVLRMMPICAPSASLFGSIQSVSELIDFLLMDGHVELAKRIIGKVKLPDSALCGIFDDI